MGMYYKDNNGWQQLLVVKETPKDILTHNVLLSELNTGVYIVKSEDPASSSINLFRVQDFYRNALIAKTGSIISWDKDSKIIIMFGNCGYTNGVSVDFFTFGKLYIPYTEDLDNDRWFTNLDASNCPTKDELMGYQKVFYPQNEIKFDSKNEKLYLQLSDANAGKGVDIKDNVISSSLSFGDGLIEQDNHISLVNMKRLHIYEEVTNRELDEIDIDISSYDDDYNKITVEIIPPVSGFGENIYPPIQICTHYEDYSLEYSHSFASFSFDNTASKIGIDIDVLPNDESNFIINTEISCVKNNHILSEYCGRCSKEVNKSVVQDDYIHIDNDGNIKIINLFIDYPSDSSVYFPVGTTIKVWGWKYV